MTGQNLIDDTAYALNQNNEATQFIAECLRWANLIQNDMFNRGDWAELIVRHSSITCDGSTSYNLTTAITGVTDFGRVREESLRYDTTVLIPKSMAWIYQNDPDLTDTGDPDYFAVDGKFLVLFPYPGSGTLYLNYVKVPAAIAQATTEAAISFLPQNHHIILSGTLFLGMRRYGVREWMAQQQIYEVNCKDALKHSGKIRYRPKQAVVNPY